VAVQRAEPGPDADGEWRAADARPGAAVSHSVPATPDHVGRLRRTVADFAWRHGASERSLESVNLAVSEALTNVVVHAYRDVAAPGPVLVVVAVHDGALIVTVADEGCGMSPRADSPGLGLGLPVMQRLADTFEIAPRAARSGTALRMAFALAG
jgi:anti-sigma regulatory factor (Ser/Thr protein kinase)